MVLGFGFGFRVSVSISGSGLRVECFAVWGFGFVFSIEGCRFGVSGLGLALRVVGSVFSGSRFRVSSWRFGVLCLVDQSFHGFKLRVRGFHGWGFRVRGFEVRQFEVRGFRFIVSRFGV